MYAGVLPGRSGMVNAAIRRDRHVKCRTDPEALEYLSSFTKLAVSGPYGPGEFCGRAGADDLLRGNFRRYGSLCSRTHYLLCGGAPLLIKLTACSQNEIAAGAPRKWC